MIEMRVRQQHQVNRRQVADFHAGTLERFSKNSQLAKFGSFSTFKSVNWDQKRRVPIQVMATCRRLSSENRMALLSVRGVSHAFQ